MAEPDELLRLTLEANAEHARASAQLAAAVQEVRTEIAALREPITRCAETSQALRIWLARQQEATLQAAARHAASRASVLSWLRDLIGRVLATRTVQTALTAATTAALLAVLAWLTGASIQVPVPAATPPPASISGDAP